MVPPDGSGEGLRRGRRLVPRRVPPLDVGHAFYLPDRLHDLAEMRQVVDLDEDRTEHGAVLRMQVGAADVGARLAHSLHDVGVQAAPVFAGDREPDGERLARGLLPVDVYPALFGSECEQVRT